MIRVPRSFTTVGSLDNLNEVASHGEARRAGADDGNLSSLSEHGFPAGAVKSFKPCAARFEAAPPQGSGR